MHLGQIVAGFLLPHDPLMASMPDAPPPEKVANCREAFARISNRLHELEIDTVIVIGDDHYTLHGPSCIPRYMIGVGDVEGPVEQWLGIERRVVPNNSPLAEHIMRYGFEHGVDWTVSKTLEFDHSIGVPVEYVVKPVPGIRTIPIYINSGFAPFISSRRAYEVGRNVGLAVAEWDGNERIAVLGTGGISHWVGMAKMGTVNEVWDRHVIEFVERGDAASLIALTDEEIIREAGNGGLEIKNWIFAMGVLGPLVGEVIAYEAVPEWICGCGFMELKAA